MTYISKLRGVETPDISHLQPRPSYPVIVTTDAAGGHVARRLVIKCEANAHIFRGTPGTCQCQSVYWDGTYRREPRRDKSG